MRSLESPIWEEAAALIVDFAPVVAPAFEQVMALIVASVVVATDVGDFGTLYQFSDSLH